MDNLTAQQEQTTAYQPGQITLRQVLSWHKAACDSEAVWWDRAEEDERFVAHDQWSESERKTFKSRKQAPIQFNRVARDVNIQLGRQIKHRMKPIGKPRGDGDVVKARALTDLMTYYWQYNMGDFEQSLAVRDQLIVRGWMEYRLQREDLSREPIQIRHVPWREIKIDPATRRPDLSDCNHIFRERWVPVDAACAYYPHQAERLKAYAGTTTDTTGGMLHRVHPSDGYNDPSDRAEFVTENRQNVRIVECWYRRTVMATHVKQLDGTITTLLPGMPINIEALMQPGAQVIEGPTSRIYFVTFCGDVVLDQGPSPYSHRFFPFVPYHAFRANVEKRTEVVAPGEPYSMVRLAKDPQRTINYNWSAVQRMLKSRATTYKKGTVSKEDLKAIVNDPQALIGVEDQGDVVFHDWLSQAAGLSRLLPMAEDQLQASTGVNEASRGDGPEASGRAIMARQVQSETANAILVDNQRFAVTLGGWILAALILQTVTAEKVVRITEDVGDRLIAVNVTDPYKAAEFRDRGIEVVDSLQGLEYDIEIDEADADLSRRDADNELLLNIVQQLGPQGILMFGDVLAEGLETRNREKIADRFSQLQQMQMGMGGGAPAPGVPVNPSSPEAAQADLAAQAQAAGAQL